MSPRIPYPVAADFAATAKGPLTRAQPLYEDVASRTGIGWELLAACDWMQCQARPRYSPVHGEKLGTVNRRRHRLPHQVRGLGQCASDLIELAMAVYWIDITARRPLSVRELANVFAAFRWGGLLKLHGISAMEFPYSVAGLTDQHLKMRWPDIKEPVRAGQAGHAVPAAVRGGPGRALPRLPGRGLVTVNSSPCLLAGQLVHTPAVLSMLAVASSRPSGLNATP